MKQSIIALNAVVTANSFNPSVFRESWLLDKQFLLADELKPGFVFSDQVVSLPSQRFTLVVVPQQLQFVPVSRETAANVVSTVLAPLVRAVPHTPFVGAGLNFVWLIEPDDEPISVVTRRLFTSQNCPLVKSFAEPDAHFGLYMSKNVPGCRLKLDVKPVIVKNTATGAPAEAIHCSFNYHLDVVAGESAADAIACLCARWAEYDTMAERMTTLVYQEVA